jgi:hypothetical protein
MTCDTLTLGGAEKSFVDWGFSTAISGEKNNQAADTFNATLVTANIADEATAPTFPFEAQVIVRVNRALSAGVFSGGTIKFQGKRVGQPMKASSSGQGVTYKFEGAWYDLSNTHYQQAFQGVSGQYAIGETILFCYAQMYNANGSSYSYGLISVGDQIQFILEWLLAQYAAQGMAAPFKFTGRNHALTPAVATNPYGGFYYWPAVGGTTISAALYSLYLPTFITKPIMCAEAIKKCLEMSPTANAWFDHATTPPTFRVTVPADKTAKTLPLFDGVSHKSISIHRRDDLFVRAVNIIFRVSSKVGSNTVIDYVPDKWGANGSNSPSDPGTGLRVVNELIDIQGSAQTSVTGHLDCEPLGFSSAQLGTTYGTVADNLAKRQWWSGKRGGEQAKFEDTRIRFQKFDVPSGSTVQTYVPDACIYYSEAGVDSTGAAVAANQEFTSADYAFYTYRLVRGTHHAWMTTAGSGPLVNGKPPQVPVKSVKVKIHAPMTYANYDITSAAGNPDLDTTGLKHGNPNSEDVHVNVELTNGPTGNYSAMATASQGECIIVGAGGIAQYLFQTLNAYQYDGDAVHVAASFADAAAANYVDLGCALNLSNGAVEWAAMNAQIQSISEDYHLHTTKVKIGVAKHLNSGQLASLLQMWRNRREWYNPATKADNTIPSGGDVDLPITAGSADTAHGLVNNGPVANVDYSTQPAPASPGLPPSVAGVMTGQLNHDPTLITKALAAVISSGKTPTPVVASSVPADANYDIKTMQPREMLLCDADGNQFYAMVHMGGSYTKV